MKLIQKIQENWGFGKLNQTSSAIYLTVTKKSDIDNLITLLSNYSLIGNKRFDFEDLSKIQGMINKDLHKTEVDLNKILEIKG